MNSKTKKLKKEISYDYILDSSSEEEIKLLREAVSELRKELNKFRSAPLMVGELRKIVEEGAILKIPNGNQFLVNVAGDCKDLENGDSVLVEQKSLTIIKKVLLSRDFDVERFVIMEKPTMSWEEVGGLKRQINEIKEVVELPLKKPELFKKVGIDPPKGILLYGPPGTGKTILAKAVAASTNSTFIEIVGSELVQKFIGEGAKLIKEIFNLARKKAPSIVFIDEIDAIAATRIEMGTSGEREVQRTFMQLLAEIDGFKNLENVKIIGCTNRRDIMDTAITRPGRLDRLIEVSLPDKKGIKEILKIHIKKMKLEKGFNIDNVVNKMKNFSGAEIKATCTEAGYLAIRNNKFIISERYFLESIIKVKEKEELEGKDYMKMFG